MRIDTLPTTNQQIQGPARRAWLHEHSPQHVQQCAALITRGLQLRDPGTSQSSLILGAGACTEVPLADVARVSDEVVLADLDLPAMQRARAELSSPPLQRRIRFVRSDLSGGISRNLARLLQQQDWPDLVSQGAQTIFAAAARCLESCPIPDPPSIEDLPEGNFGLVVSSLVLSQLFSYPLLDVLDHIQQLTPSFFYEQERHRAYQEATQAFRTRIITAHLHLLRSLLDQGGVVALLSDIRGFAFAVHGTDHDAAHRRSIPLVPRTFPELVAQNFAIVEEAQWEWISDLPERERPGRGYVVAGYILNHAQTSSSPETQVPQ